MKKTIATLLLTVILLTLKASGASAATGTITVTYGQTEARSILAMVNEFRQNDDAWFWNPDNTTKTTRKNLSKLTYDYDLEQIAMQRAAEIAVSFSHTRPNGTSCFTAYSEFVYTSTVRGENIARGQKTAERAFLGWLEESKDYSGQGHRRLMLSTSANAIGIAHVTYNGVDYWVMEVAKTTNKSTKTSALNGTKTVTVDGISGTSTGSSDSSESVKSSTEKSLGTCTISSLTNTSSGIKATWSAVSGATKYYVYRKTGSGSCEKIASTTKTSYTDKTASSGKTYTYKVVPVSGSAKGSGTAKKIVRLTGAKVSSAKAKSSTSIKLTLKTVKKAAGYQIQYSTSSDFSNSKTVTVTSTSKTLKNLKSGKTYYVRVRAYTTVNGSKVYSAWSAKKSVKLS
ncbi:MAG: CAP domain-containing protein [Lachnospiraceae bacterium]|nr:CAP domain-containing protein [Lachnospiraceae bacterium]